MDLSEYKTDEMGKYGIFDKLNIDPSNEVDWGYDEDYLNRFNKLLKLREEENQENEEEVN